jgi:hypothetical protein
VFGDYAKGGVVNPCNRSDTEANKAAARLRKRRSGRRPVAASLVAGAAVLGPAALPVLSLGVFSLGAAHAEPGGSGSHGDGFGGSGDSAYVEASGYAGSPDGRSGFENSPEVGPDRASRTSFHNGWDITGSVWEGAFGMTSPFSVTGEFETYPDPQWNGWNRIAVTPPKVASPIPGWSAAAGRRFTSPVVNLGDVVGSMVDSVIGQPAAPNPGSTKPWRLVHHHRRVPRSTLATLRGCAATLRVPLVIDDAAR